MDAVNASHATSVTLRMTRPHLWILLLVALSSPAMAGLWIDHVRSNEYVSSPVPTGWLPDRYPSTISSVRSYPKAPLQLFTLKEFISLYGPPSRRLDPRSGKGQSYAVYDLSEGYQIYLYLDGNTDDDHKHFFAGVVVNGEGRDVGPVIK